MTYRLSAENTRLGLSLEALTCMNTDMAVLAGDENTGSIFLQVGG